jgi:hypothetical protein
MNPKEKIDFIKVIATHLQNTCKTPEINQFLTDYGIQFDKQATVDSKKLYVQSILNPQPLERIIAIATDLSIPIPASKSPAASNIKPDTNATNAQSSPTLSQQPTERFSLATPLRTKSSPTTYWICCTS